MFEDTLNAIKYICQKRLEEHFSKGIPYEIQMRYDKEIQYLEQSEYFDEFEKVFMESKVNKSMICSKGTISGSIIYFLVTEHGYNPLPPYYYCAECGYYEPIHKWGNCVDAPDDTCPKCGETIRAEGYNVSIESVWGLNGKKAIGFEKEDIIHPVVEKRMNQLIKEFKPQSFEDKIKVCVCASNIYSWEKDGNEELDLDRLKSFIFPEEFKKSELYTREDIYETLCSKGIIPEDAFKTAEFVRKGGVVKRPSEMKKYEIPEEIMSVAQNICYLESRPHAMQTAYRYWGLDK